MELWQVPANVYQKMKVSFAVLYEKVNSCGELGKYLFEKMMHVNESFVEYMVVRTQDKDCSKGAKAAMFPGGESWQLGDSPGVGIMLTDHDGQYYLIGAPRFEYGSGKYLLRPDNEHKIRVYDDVDSHFILEDFFAKLQYYYGNKG